MGTAVLWVCRGQDGCWWYRAELPRRWLAARGTDVRMTMAEGEDVGHIDDFGAVVLQRISYSSSRATTEMLAFIRALRARGAAVYYEVDDDLWHNPVFKGTGPIPVPRALRRAALAQIERLIAACSGVIATTPDLGRVLARVNRQVTVIPNAVPAALCDHAPRPHAGVRIGWVGSTSHGLEGDFGAMLPVLRRTLEACPEVSLVFMGWHPPEIEGWPRTTWMEWVPIESYYEALADLELDIFVAPLADTRFNLGKSPVKLLEAGALGWAIIASPHGPYRNVLQEDCTGLYAATGPEWAAALQRLIVEPETRHRLGQAVQTYVRRNHTMDQTGPLWAAALAVPLTQPGAVTVGAGEE
jgi:glycosyltransferase involved in cell wall biosynthesis